MQNQSLQQQQQTMNPSPNKLPQHQQEQQNHLYPSLSKLSHQQQPSNHNTKHSNKDICKTDIKIMTIMLIMLIVGNLYVEYVWKVQAMAEIQARDNYVGNQSVLWMKMREYQVQMYYEEMYGYMGVNGDLRKLGKIIGDTKSYKDLQQLNKDQLQQQQQQEQQEPQVQLTDKQKQRIKNAKQQDPNNRQQQIQQSLLNFKPIAGITLQKILSAKQSLQLKSQPIPSSSQIAIKQQQYYQNQYKINQYKSELPFCIVVPTYNNQDNLRYRKNLDSIIQQEYGNYHIVVIDDASTDGTGGLIEGYVQEIEGRGNVGGYDFRGRIRVVRNQVQRHAMPNIRLAAMQYCKAEQIFMIVDGDDQLIGRQVLKLFNSQFQQKGVWFMYTNFITHIGTVGFSRPIKQQTIKANNYRKSAFVTSHLRAYYTQLLRLIKQQDLQDDDGQYLRAANDVAICIPILEMAHERIIYVPEITYMYNSNTGLNNHRVRLREQADNNRKIRHRRSYDPIDQLFPAK